jgi:hypothetical protein
MPIYSGNHEVTAIYIGKKAIAEVYEGTKLVWSAIAKWWRNKNIWRDKYKWKY